MLCNHGKKTRGQKKEEGAMGVFEVGKRGWQVQRKVSPVNRMRLIIPGITMRNMGSSFMYPHMMQPAFTCDMFLAERQRCTMTCQGKPNEEGR